MKKINFQKEYKYEEYFINDSFMKKLYNLYINKTIFDKILDLLVLLSLIIIIMTLILEYLIKIDQKIILIFESLSIFILSIFILELYRDYLKSKSAKDFFKNHWIDFLLIMFLSLYFLFITFLGFLQILKLDILKNLISKIKHFKIIYNHIKNKFKK